MTNYIVLTSGGAFPAVPVVISVISAVLLFVLLRVAFYLYGSGEVEVSARRIVDLDPREVKLSLKAYNRKATSRNLTEVCLAIKKDNQFVRAASLQLAPLVSKEIHSEVTKENGVYGIVLHANAEMELIADFRLEQPTPTAYLVGKNAKGRYLAAAINLYESSYRLLEFKRIPPIK